MTPFRIEEIASWLRTHWVFCLLCAYIFLLPFSRLVEVPLMLLAFGGIHRLWREGRPLFKDQGVQLLSAVFLAYWIPIFFSAFDAVHPEKTWVTAAGMPRYWLAGLCALTALRHTQDHHRLWGFIAWLMVIWSVDVLVQYMSGQNLLGYAYPNGERLNGVFGHGNYKLGPILALFSPLLFEYGKRNWPRWFFWPAVAVLGAAVLLIATRIGWVMLGVIGALYLWRYWWHYPRRALRRGVIVIGAVLALTATAYVGSMDFRDRVDRTLLVFEGDWQAVNRALSYRLEIWEVSVEMAAAHPINGVGARGYRYAYQDYAERADPWVSQQDRIGAYYAHQLVLELWSETGVIGFVGFCVLVWLVIYVYFKSGKDRRLLLFPYGLALLSAVFPFNSHYAIYSTFWSTTLWWLVMGYCAVLASDEARGVRRET